MEGEKRGRQRTKGKKRKLDNNPKNFRIVI